MIAYYIRILMVTVIYGRAGKHGGSNFKTFDSAALESHTTPYFLPVQLYTFKDFF